MNHQLIPVEIKGVSMTVWMNPDQEKTIEKARDVLEYIKQNKDTFGEDTLVEKIATMISGRVEKIELHGGVENDQVGVSAPNMREYKLNYRPMRGKTLAEVDPAMLQYLLTVQRSFVDDEDAHAIEQFLKQRGAEVAIVEEDDIPF